MGASNEFLGLVPVSPRIRTVEIGVGATTATCFEQNHARAQDWRPIDTL